MDVGELAPDEGAVAGGPERGHGAHWASLGVRVARPRSTGTVPPLLRTRMMAASQARRSASPPPERTSATPSRTAARTTLPRSAPAAISTTT